MLQKSWFHIIILNTLLLVLGTTEAFRFPTVAPGLNTSNKITSFRACIYDVNRHRLCHYFHSTIRSSSTSLNNIYDNWRSDAIVDNMCLDHENVQQCLEEFMYSSYGHQMFGIHDRPASIGITGTLELVEICGPEIILQLEGKFWHRRETVLGRAAMWLNARMPEITDVTVSSEDELKDYVEITDEFTGDVIEGIDRQAPDFNGDRQTMTYQGIDPDVRGPFPYGAGSFQINPA